MDRRKRARLAAGGWRIGTAAEFLEMDAAEATIVEIRLALSRTLKQERLARRLTQAMLASRIGSSQSRVAKMEAGDPSVSIELLVRTLLAAGTSGEAIGAAFAAAVPRAMPTRARPPYTSA